MRCAAGQTLTSSRALRLPILLCSVSRFRVLQTGAGGVQGPLGATVSSDLLVQLVQVSLRSSIHVMMCFPLTISSICSQELPGGVVRSVLCAGSQLVDQAVA